MPDDKVEKYEYLGDGVYAHYDGVGLWLLANDLFNPTDKIYLEPTVLESLNRFWSYVRSK